jgi:DnaD/phage-associated family protein
MTFPGFPEDTTTHIRIPEQFFHHLLLDIDELDELKLTLYVFWRFERMEAPFHYLSFTDLKKDKQLIQSMGKNPNAAHSALEVALQSAVQRGTLLQADYSTSEGQDKIICLNSPKGRAAIEAIQRGEWQKTDTPHQPIEIHSEHPNIFQLYEANVGPLTPMIADALRDAEKTYQANWIEDAFRISVERNKRNWHYIEAILHRWQEGGRDDRKEQQDRRDTEEARRRYGEWEK